MNKNYSFALTAVLNDTGLNREDIHTLEIKKDAGLYCLSFRTDWQSYEAFVDAESFQVRGLNFMPCLEDWCVGMEAAVDSCVA